MRKILRALALMLCLLCLTGTVMAEDEAVNVIDVMNQYTRLDLSPYAGRVILLNFFTEWCPYCMQEMPDLKEVYELYDPDALQIVFVHPWDGEDASNTESVKARFGLEEMVFFEDEDGMVCALVGLQGYPATLIVDTDGTLAAGANYMVTKDMLTGAMDMLGVAKREKD